MQPYFDQLIADHYNWFTTHHHPPPQELSNKDDICHASSYWTNIKTITNELITKEILVLARALKLSNRVTFRALKLSILAAASTSHTDSAKGVRVTYWAVYFIRAIPNI